MLDQLREALEEARPVEDNASDGMVAGQTAPPPAFGFDELNAACGAARVNGYQDGFETGARSARAASGFRAASARVEGETLGAVAGLTAAVAIVQRRIATIPDGQGRVAEVLDGIHAELVEGLGELDERGLHGERAPGEERTTGGAEHFLRSSRA